LQRLPNTQFYSLIPMKTASLIFKNNEFEQLVSEIAADATYVNFCQVRDVGANLSSRIEDAPFGQNIRQL
jgi:hypothetical protein